MHYLFFYNLLKNYLSHKGIVDQYKHTLFHNFRQYHILGFICQMCANDELCKRKYDFQAPNMSIVETIS